MVHPSLSWDNKTDLYTCNKNKVCCDHEEAKCVLLECFNMFLIPSLKAIGLRCFSKRKQIFIQRVIGLDEIVGQWKDSGLFPKGLGSGDILKSGWGYTISAHIRHHTDDFHLENSDVKSFINKIDLVLPKPVEEFEVELARNIRCNRCGHFLHWEHQLEPTIIRLAHQQ
ncbi:hypothetical protein BDP27DRAFT_918086 [Rhodocollybia butyracea]|uniref:Uncharacterized protein n=1 Tax=Rhodocollybia butyracea TaxID=206335 RepID=A0A9P5PQ73_9AGAR|nr:hypothetical protein BDP27DRAFT_918086 [Rhodocollybia butyracea]